jgi:hypothetical protein
LRGLFFCDKPAVLRGSKDPPLHLPGMWHTHLNRERLPLSRRPNRCGPAVGFNLQMLCLSRSEQLQF